MKIIKRRAVSPAIALILLIGVTVLAGVAVISTVILVFNAEDPISITISKPVYMASTETDIAFFDPLVDSMLLPVTNNMRERLIFETENIQIYNASSNEILDRWSVIGENSEIFTQGQETIILNLQTEGKFDQDEFSIGDKFFVQIPAKKEDQTNYQPFFSQTFTITASDTDPLFRVVGLNNAFQDGNTVYFSAVDPDTKNISRNLEFGIFNYGNAEKEKSFPVTLQLENTTLFSTNSTQTLLTVPISGSTNNDTVCDIGEACAVGSFNLTKWSINRTKDTYGAFLSIGTQSINFNLQIVEVLPNYYLTMPNQKGKNNNQWGEILQFNSKKYWETETLELIMTAWNNETPTIPTGATLELMELNATAFTLDTSATVSKTIPIGDSIRRIPSGNNRCGKGSTKNSACMDFTWTITRNIIQTKDKKNPIVSYTVMEPYYFFKIKWVETGMVFTFKIQVAPPK